LPPSHFDVVKREFLRKASWGLSSLGAGVKRCHLISPVDGALIQELYTRDGSGTLITRDLYDGIRRAQVEDIGAIIDLITPLVRAGNLVQRSREVVEKDISSYFVYSRDDLVVACGQVKKWGDFAEVGCLVVHPDYQKDGRGNAMLGYLERFCLQSGVSNIFLLSTVTMGWFLDRGFKEAPFESLPESKREKVDKSRGSKVYLKTINGERDLDADELMWDT
ncbi:hypothetical protein TrRE_jg6190, partial [Triparma retinervis]